MTKEDRASTGDRRRGLGTRRGLGQEEQRLRASCRRAGSRPLQYVRGRVGSAVQARVCARRASSNARARVKPSKPVHELAGVCKVARANGPQSAAASRYRRPLALFVPRRLHLDHAGDISITCLPTTPAPRQPSIKPLLPLPRAALARPHSSYGTAATLPARPIAPRAASAAAETPSRRPCTPACPVISILFPNSEPRSLAASSAPTAQRSPHAMPTR
jgi:hypothetical protein